MEIFVERSKKKYKKNFSGKAKTLLKLLKIELGTVLIVRNGALITEEDDLNNTDRVKIVSVISGG